MRRSEWERYFPYGPDQDDYWEAFEVERPGPERRMHSGTMWPLLEPRPELVRLDDVAEHLSRLCRFGGAVMPEHYSVAQHAALVAHALYIDTHDADLALWGLHHDDEEHVLGDVIGPLKKLWPMGFFRWLGKRTQVACCQAFGLPDTEPPLVPVYDQLVLTAEQRDLQQHTGVRPDGWDKLSFDIDPIRGPILHDAAIDHRLHAARWPPPEGARLVDVRPWPQGYAADYFVALHHRLVELSKLRDKDRTDAEPG